MHAWKSSELSQVRFIHTAQIAIHKTADHKFPSKGLTILRKPDEEQQRKNISARQILDIMWTDQDWNNKEKIYKKGEIGWQSQIANIN